MTEEAPKRKAAPPAEAGELTSAELTRLLDERKDINAAIRAEKSRNKLKARTLRNRHGVLTGLAALEWMKVFPNPALAEQLQRARDWWLTKPEERALFGLPPRLELVTSKRRPKAKPASVPAADNAVDPKPADEAGQQK